MDAMHTEGTEIEQQAKGHSRSHMSLGQSTVDYKSLQLNDNPKASLAASIVGDQDTKSSSLLVCFNALLFQVAVRCRPLLKSEVRANIYEIVRVVDKKVR